MAFTLSQASKSKLSGVHPDLVRVVERAIEVSTVDFKVLEGLRTVARQKQLMAAGASSIKDPTKGRHVSGHAVDLGAMVGASVRWDWPLYNKVAEAMKAAAKELGVPIVWGGDWKTFKDGPHFELDRKAYP